VFYSITLNICVIYTDIRYLAGQTGSKKTTFSMLLSTANISYVQSFGSQRYDLEITDKLFGRIQVNDIE